jgi:hypothetical protein
MDGAKAVWPIAVIVCCLVHGTEVELPPCVEKPDQ